MGPTAVGDVPGQLGAKGRLVQELAGEVGSLHSQLTPLLDSPQPPAFSGATHSIDTIVCESVGPTSTKVSYTTDVWLSGLMKVITPLVAPAIWRLGSQAQSGLETTVREGRHQ